MEFQSQSSQVKTLDRNFTHLFSIKHKGGNRMRNDSWLLPLLGGLGQFVHGLPGERGEGMSTDQFPFTVLKFII